MTKTCVYRKRGGALTEQGWYMWVWVCMCVFVKRPLKDIWKVIPVTDHYEERVDWNEWENEQSERDITDTKDKGRLLTWSQNKWPRVQTDDTLRCIKVIMKSWNHYNLVEKKFCQKAVDDENIKET